jgi:hypothetical protein
MKKLSVKELYEVEKLEEDYRKLKIEIDRIFYEEIDSLVPKTKLGFRISTYPVNRFWFLGIRAEWIYDLDWEELARWLEELKKNIKKISKQFKKRKKDIVKTREEIRKELGKIEVTIPSDLQFLIDKKIKKEDLFSLVEKYRYLYDTLNNFNGNYWFRRNCLELEGKWYNLFIKENFEKVLQRISYDKFLSDLSDYAKKSIKLLVRRYRFYSVKLQYVRQFYRTERVINRLSQ